MIKSLTLQFGRAPGLAPEPITCTPVTVFVGPNNSGKSKILQELHRFCTNGQSSTTDVILKSVEFESLPRDVAEQRVQAITQRPGPGEMVHHGHTIVGKRGARVQIPLDNLLNALTNPNSNPNWLCSWYLGFNTMMLDGESRIRLIHQQGAGDLQQHAQTSFQTLFRDDHRRAELRRIIHDAFGLHLVLDPTHLGQLRLRLSQLAPPSPIIERGIHDEAVAFHAAALQIDFASDGIKAFTGMMSEIVAGDPAILLIDEPEAFLHPALSFVLGKEISKVTVGSEKRLFVSTHSPNFVMGCVQSGAPINIVRLTYREGVATARILGNADILRLMRNPLLRSTSVLSGLFHESVVVTESDADRAFYQEINERILLDSPEHGIRNCLFINAQNKQTVPTIMKPLRQLGIPTAGIVDIDVIKDGGAVWSTAVDGAFLPSLDQQATALMRSAAKKKFEASGRDMKRDGGIAILTGTDREGVENLFRRLAEYGLFVVPDGELESWLKHLGATGHGPAWLVNIFEKLGEDPMAAGYVRPASDDAWAFMRSIRDWLVNPTRRGIPA